MQVEPERVADAVKRLRRAQGQMAGVLRMIDEGRDCGDVVTQLAAVSRALDRAGFALIAAAMQQCLEQGADGVQDRRRLERLFLSLA